MTQGFMALVIGALFGVATFLILRRDVVKVVFGTLVLGQAANIYLITMGGINGAAPVLGHQGSGHAEVTDPLVQALVLTAIVIGLGSTALLLVLTYRLYEENGTIDLEEISRGEDEE